MKDSLTQMKIKKITETLIIISQELEKCRQLASSPAFISWNHKSKE